MKRVTYLDDKIFLRNITGKEYANLLQYWSTHYEDIIVNISNNRY